MSAYSNDEDGRPIPVILKECPHQKGNNVNCDILLSHWRKRKTGPLQFLAIVKCKIHKKSFTLYPCGLLPYKRQVLVGNLDLDGSIVHAEDTITFAKDTLFEGACDKAESKSWPKEQSKQNPSFKRFDTQAKHM